MGAQPAARVALVFALLCVVAAAAASAPATPVVRTAAARGGLSPPGATNDTIAERRRSLRVKPSPEPVTLPSADRRPHFFLIGTAKSGSTSLWDHIVLHPRVVPPTRKELHFFNNDRCGVARDLRLYADMFPLLKVPPQQRHGQITGEGTPTYITYDCALHQLALLNPAARMVVILRDPWARTVAEWRFSGTRGFEKEIRWEMELVTRGLARVSGNFTAFAHNVDSCLGSVHRGWHHIRRSMYLPQLLGLLQHFPPHQVLVVQAEQFFAEADETLRRVDKFLGLDPDERDTSAPLSSSQHSHRRAKDPPPLPETERFLKSVLQPAAADVLQYLDAHPQLTAGVRFNASLWPTYAFDGHTHPHAHHH